MTRRSSTRSCIRLLAVVLLLAGGRERSGVTAFQVVGVSPPACRLAQNRAQKQQQQHPNTVLKAIIQADEVDFEFDAGLGGVRLAQESAILLRGTVQHAPGKASARLDELVRYSRLRKISGGGESAVGSVMDKVGMKLIATGRGRQVYKDPGSTAVKEVTQAPRDAVRDALVGAGSCMDCSRVQINFAGGEDLQVLEVVDSVQHLVLNLDVKTKCQVSYSSLSDSNEFPMEAATVTVVGWTAPAKATATTAEEDGDSGKNLIITESSSVLAGMSNVERAIALGHLFFRDGVYYTVVEEDVNPAVA